MRAVIRYLGYALFVMLVAIAFCLPVSARPPVVDDDWAHAEYSTIQDAIDGESDGSEIWVWAGHYTENVVINKTITLVGNSSSNTTIDGGGSGTVVYTDSNHVNITGFRINGSGSGDEGVTVKADWFHIDNCTVDNTGSENIYLMFDSNAPVVDNCTFRNSSRGISMVLDASALIKKCEFRDHQFGGVFLSGTNVHTFQWCSFYGTGFRFNGAYDMNYDSHTIENCTVNGAPVRYYADMDGVVVNSDAGQVIVASCSNVTMDGLDIVNGTVGLTFVFSKNVTVTDSVIDDQYNGMWVTETHDLDVSGTTFSRPSGYCIHLIKSDNVTIDGSTVWADSGTYGVRMESSCADVTINGTGVSGFTHGLWTAGDRLTISNCTINDTSTGVLLIGGEGHAILRCNVTGNGNGVQISAVAWCNITNSSLHGNSIYGIYVSDGAHNVTITYNEIFDNDNYGLGIHNANDYSVHHNNFAGNGGTGSQGYDSDGGHHWDDGVSEGNYWDDWDGNGTYDIDGGKGVEDRYPLSDPADTDAPEKISEFVPLVAIMSLVLLSMAGLRRRRY